MPVEPGDIYGIAQLVPPSTGPDRHFVVASILENIIIAYVTLMFLLSFAVIITFPGLIVGETGGPEWLRNSFCSLHFATQSAYKVPELFHGLRRLSKEEKLKDLSFIVAQVPDPLPLFANEQDIRKPDWLYFFALYSALSFCESYEDAAKFSLPSLAIGGTLPTGEFQVILPTGNGRIFLTY